MQILIAAGGTGGHVYPALAIAEALKALHPDVTLAFVGSVDGFERPLIAESGVTFARYDEVRAGPLHGVHLMTALKSIAQLGLGTVQAFGLLVRHRPSALLLTGGWVGLPVALAAWVLRVPSLIYLPDIEPGLTIRALRPFATQVAITTPASEQYFRRGQTIVTGYPLRQEVLNATRADAIAYFKLDPSRKTLLVFGGSRGARTINNALIDLLPVLQQRDDLQIIHVTGTLDWDDIQSRLQTMGELPHYHPFAYLHREMGLAFAAADLVLSRSGASILGEFPYFGLPSILVPYPYAWRYQKVNADYLAERGAAIVMQDADMARDLLGTMNGLLDDPARLAQMRDAARALAQPDGARRAVEALTRLAKG
ncbi:MAG: undecaprenyldiphospho-muramoylpentapeptide beta-N-acetylglucosaminyltransferase [Chloroflexota bacterium]|nr:undecaprenyldiphospho-muramoylpentapeptide beta-N-acetylglucosaminyltransferase [Chloroflexota bacterium]